MFNRTNASTSANTNRLNLGTRSTAQDLGVVNGDSKTLRLRPAHLRMRSHSLRRGDRAGFWVIPHYGDSHISADSRVPLRLRLVVAGSA